MNKKLTKTFSLLVVAVLCSSVLAACTPAPSATTASTTLATTATTAATTAGIDTSKAVVLQFWMVNDAPKDLQTISDKVNELTKKDLNCTVVFNYTSVTDAATKYSLMLSSGQPIDLIYTAVWMDFWNYARQGAFLALNDLLPKAAPLLTKYIGDAALKQATLNGKIMTVPCTWKEYTTNGITYRKDLQEKYNLPEPNSLENLEKYLLGVKQNMPEQELCMEYPMTTLTAAFTAMEVLPLKYKWVNNTRAKALSYGIVADYATPSQTKVYWGSDDFITDMTMFKRWADQGFWSKSSLTQQPDAAAFDNGRIVASLSGENPMKYSQHLLLAEANHPDWKVGYYNFSLSTGNAIAAHPCQNGFALPLACPNPERALMFFEKLVLDKTYNQLTQYGIQGVNYEVTPEGYYKMLGTTATNGFPREGMLGYAWRNEDYMIYPKSFDVVKALNKVLDPLRKMNIIDGFAEDFSSYKSKRAAVSAVMTQYLAPLQAGLVDDVVASTAEFMAKAKAAGLEEIQAVYIQQWEAYIKSLNLK